MRLFAIFVLFTLFSLNLSAGIGVDPSGKVHVHRNLPMEVEGSPLLRFDLEGMPHLNACSPLVTFSVAVFVDREINKHYPSYDAPAPTPKPIWNSGPLNLSYSLDQLGQLFCQNMRDQFAAGRANQTWTFDNGRGWGHVGVVGQEYFDRLDRFLNQPYTEYDLIRMCPDLSKAFEQQTGFNPRLLDIQDYPGFFERRFCDVNHSYYYQNKFAQTHPKLLMHKLRYYQIDAFCYYLVRRPEFEKFVLKLEPEIVNHGALKEVLKNSLPSSEYSKINTNLQDMLKYTKKQVAEREAAARQKVQRDNLLNRGFNPAGMQLVKNYQHEFEYPCNPTQTNLTREITNHYNQLADFLANKSYDQQIKEFGHTSETFARGANRANSQQLTTVASQLLQVAQDLLSLGKGLAKGAVDNVVSTVMIKQALSGLYHLVSRIGINLAKLGHSTVKLHVACKHADQAWADAMLEKEQVKNQAKFDQIGMLYQAVKQHCQSASRDDLLQITGGLIITGVIMRCGGVIAITNSGMQAAGLASLGYYQATVLSKLGEAGRQIQQVVGLAAKVGVGKVERGLQVIKDHPQIVKVGQTAAKAIQTGRKALRQTNRYLKETSRAVASKVQKIQVGEQIKKIPRACVAKIKQVVDDEAIVVDTWGNTWRSPVNSNHWEVQLSEMGKKNLVLLNEAAVTRGATTAKEIGKKVKRQHVKIPMCPKTKAVLKQIKTELRAKTAQMRKEGVTYGKFYNGQANNNLDRSLIDFKNFVHEYAPEMPLKLKRGQLTPDLTGFHWDRHRQLEGLGFYSLKNIELLPGGMYKADITINGVTKVGNSFFPAHWDWDDLLSKITEACHNVRLRDVRANGDITIIGAVKEGFEIKIKLGKRGRNLTIYPIRKGGA